MGVIEIFEQNALCYAQHKAVQLNDNYLIYEELNKRANSLALYLRETGVQPNTIVALYLERSIEFIIAVLAVVKAGGAYLPLDIEAPNSRTDLILEDSSPVKIITQASLYPALSRLRLQPEHSDKIIKIESILDSGIGHQSIENLSPVNSLADTLCVIYTSGSTGKPKGCLIPHRAALNLAKNEQYIPISDSDNIAQVANTTFDIMIFDTWGTLLNGATLHIIPQTTLLSLDILANTLKQSQISIVVFATSMFNLIAQNHPEAFDNLRYVIFGGEKANIGIITSLLDRKKRYNLLNLCFVNAYGPTENTNATTAFFIRNKSGIDKAVPIGRPISNVRTYVLDQNLKLVPPGTVGELYIAGESLALGYLNEAETTTQKFIQSPWDPKERIYRTGDLVYWSENVGIIFVDRIDDSQVKIHGFRVELGEIEACIIRHPFISQAVVLVENVSAEGSRLVCYISFKKDERIDFFTLHQFLSENLPYYMLPRKIIQLDKIPLTANGKIDKKQLVNLHGNDISTYPTVSINRMEQFIIQVIEEFLKISKVNPVTNFFDLGISSLKLTQICELLNIKLKTITQRKIDVIDIFTYPTAQLLARYITDTKQEVSRDLGDKFNKANQQRKMLVAIRNRHANP